MLCPGRYTRNGVDLVCSHPKSRTPFNVAQALAYSCNFFFAAVAERLSASSFTSTLAQFGFGERTGVNASGESAGSVRAGEWRIKDALGEGEGLLATPIQMLTAYASLFNGGHLYRPRQADAEGFIPEERAAMNSGSEDKAVAGRGVSRRGRVWHAVTAALTELPMFIFGKTEHLRTATALEDRAGSCRWRPLSRRLAVPGRRSRRNRFDSRCWSSQGARTVPSALKCAHRCFDAYVKPKMEERDRGRRRTIISDAFHPQPEIRSPQSAIPQGSVLREGRTRTLSLEEYVLGVLSMEASTEDELEALKAQAVVSRTFALKNLGRHSGEGYDLCSNTHCQQYSSDPSRLRDQMRRAVEETAGELLEEPNGQPIDAYFHAACGGATASIESLWGVAAPSYMRGVRDDYCAAAPGREWTDEIPAARLAKALTTDPRTDVGPRVNEVIVTKRDASGRAEMITIEGERRKQVRGWEFKMIVGRALGWNVLKSSRFEAVRRGPSFVFRGSGLGMASDCVNRRARDGAEGSRIPADTRALLSRRC